MALQRLYQCNTIYNPLNGLATAQDQGLLWVTDDDTNIYHILPSGQVISSFSMPDGALPSGITVAPDGTLYVVSEHTNKLYHFKRDGSLIGSAISYTTWETGGSPETEGVAYDDRDDTLWIIDDGRLKVYHTNTNGTLIQAYNLPVEIGGPQGISLDKTDYTFWVADNDDRKIYHLDEDIQIITNDTISDLSSVVDSFQGCCIEPIQKTLWLLAYNSLESPYYGYMYRVDPRAKTLVRVSGYPIACSVYGSTGRGTGITFDYN